MAADSARRQVSHEQDTYAPRFNVGVVVALVLGGVAALVLATALAVGGYGRKSNAPSRGVVSAAPAAPSAASSLPEAEVEYLLESGEPASTAERKP
jgi:hypothetical protein